MLYLTWTVGCFVVHLFLILICCSLRLLVQPLWSPELCDSVGKGTEASESQSGSPDKCAFCHAVVPQDRMNSHLYLHFSPNNEAHK